MITTLRKESPLTYKTLPNLSNYRITETGEVYSIIRNKYLKGLTKPDGYKMVFLNQDDGFRKWHYIHRIVAKAFIPNPENHPKFKGYYSYKGITSTSINDLANKLGIYPIKLHRLYKSGLIQFIPKQRR